MGARHGVAARRFAAGLKEALPACTFDLSCLAMMPFVPDLALSPWRRSETRLFMIHRSHPAASHSAYASQRVATPVAARSARRRQGMRAVFMSHVRATLVSLLLGVGLVCVGNACVPEAGGCRASSAAMRKDRTDDGKAHAFSGEVADAADPEGGAKGSEGGLGADGADVADAARSDGNGSEVYVFHVVGLGETLWDIALAYHTTIAAIVEANGAKAGQASLLRLGTKLRIPGATEVQQVTKRSASEAPSLDSVKGPAGYHVLAPGETLWDVSRAYEVDIDTLLRVNQLEESDVARLREGKKLLVPGLSAARQRELASSTKQGKGASHGSTGHAGASVQHRMMAGETAWDLARQYQVSLAELMAANRLQESDVTSLREGQVLRIPGVKRRADGRYARLQTSEQRRANSLGQRLGLGTRAAAGKLLTGHLAPSWIRAAGGRAGSFPGTIRWPVTKGWFTRGYGSGEGGYHLAIDIMGEIGWNVRAAESGIVGYAGNEVRGYGNVVFVIHAGGWVTMYAHNSVNFVVAGQRVSRGTVLAEVGSTGISRGPHVHFELLYQGKSCDPSSLFRPGVMHRGGKRASIKPAVWRSPSQRPSAVACHPRRRHPNSQWVEQEDPGG